MKVYIVTCGEYSSYHIETICETFEQAKQKCMMAVYKDSWDTPQIEVWDTETGLRCDSERKRWRVWWSDGSLLCEESYEESFTFNAGSLWDKINGRNFNFELEGLEANDEKHAIKIASDMLAEYKAMLGGIVTGGTIVCD